jgi:hypothetical protein
MLLIAIHPSNANMIATAAKMADNNILMRGRFIE